MTQKTTPCLWFDDQAEEAAQYYISIFKNSKITSVSRYTDSNRKPEGSVLVVMFELDGQEYMALNGGPYFSFTPAISLMVNCETQDEVDDLWRKLSDGGAEEQCGWLKDKYGVSWQIVPRVLHAMMIDPDVDKVRRVTAAVLQMIKLDIAELKRAYEQG